VVKETLCFALVGVGGDEAQGFEDEERGCDVRDEEADGGEVGEPHSGVGCCRVRWVRV
jgi:hypothetical protein